MPERYTILYVDDRFAETSKLHNYYLIFTDTGRVLHHNAQIDLVSALNLRGEDTPNFREDLTNTPGYIEIIYLVNDDGTMVAGDIHPREIAYQASLIVTDGGRVLKDVYHIAKMMGLEKKQQEAIISRHRSIYDESNYPEN